MGWREGGRQTGKWICAGLACLVAIVGVFAIFFYFRTVHYTSDALRTSDLARMKEQNPECLMLSMMPPEPFSADDFSYFRGLPTVKADHRFENLYDIKDFLDEVEAPPSVVYLVADPISISSRYGFHASLYGWAYRGTLLAKIRESAETTYEILLSYYPLRHWESLSEKRREDAISAYRDFVNVFGGEPNVKIFFFGAEEWLIANPGNYETENSCNEAVTRTLAAFTIRDDAYLLTADNMEEKFSLIRLLAEQGSAESLLLTESLAGNGSANPFRPQDSSGKLADLRDMDIVFFGDSVIGNYTDSTSIPGVVAGRSGARTYNLGVGGTTATFVGEQDGTGALSLHSMIEAFLKGDALRIDDRLQAKRSIEEYVLDHADGEPRRTCFILNFGLNDYFTGMPINAPMTEDGRSCYAGALRSAVSRLREAYPGCRIILATPTYSAEFQGGTEIRSPEGGALRDYADAVISVAKEMGAEVIDNFYGLGVDAGNVWTYISDGTHPNELGRYVIGRRIAWHLAGG